MAVLEKGNISLHDSFIYGIDMGTCPHNVRPLDGFFPLDKDNMFIFNNMGAWYGIGAPQRNLDALKNFHHKLVAFTMLVREGSDDNPEFFVYTKRVEKSEKEPWGLMTCHVGLRSFITGRDLCYHMTRDETGALEDTYIIDWVTSAAQSSIRSCIDLIEPPINNSLSFDTGNLPCGLIRNKLREEFMGGKELGVLFIQKLPPDNSDFKLTDPLVKQGEWFNEDEFRAITKHLEVKTEEVPKVFDLLSRVVVDSLDVIIPMCKEVLKPTK